MKNPFMAGGHAVGHMFHSAAGLDAGSGAAEAGAVIVTPIVFTFSFIGAFFKH